MRLFLCAVASFAVACASEQEENIDPVQASMQREVGQLHQAIEQRPGTPLLEFQLGQVFKKYGMIDSARTAFKRSISLYESFPEAHFELAQLYYDDGMLAQSAQFYEQTLRFDQDNVTAYNNLGYIYKRLGELKKAAAAYEQAIAVDSTFVEAYNNLGQLYKADGKNKEAIELYRRSIEVRSDFPESYVNLATLYQSVEDAAEIEVWRDFLQQFGDEQSYSIHARERLDALVLTP
jgi:tetratricopeptide (TPR) repeat protein